MQNSADWPQILPMYVKSPQLFSLNTKLDRLFFPEKYSILQNFENFWSYSCLNVFLPFLKTFFSAT